MPQIVCPEQRASSDAMREMLAIYRDAEDLINIGAYVDGSNPKIDRAKARIDSVNAFLQQRSSEPTSSEDTLRQMLMEFPG